MVLLWYTPWHYYVIVEWIASKLWSITSMTSSSSAVASWYVGAAPPTLKIRGGPELESWECPHRTHFTWASTPGRTSIPGRHGTDRSDIWTMRRTTCPLGRQKQQTRKERGRLGLSCLMQGCPKLFHPYWMHVVLAKLKHCWWLWYTHVLRSPISLTLFPSFFPVYSYIMLILHAACTKLPKHYIQEI